MKLFYMFSLILCVSIIIYAQPNPGTMAFGTSTTLLANAQNPSVDASANALLNDFDLSAISSATINLAFATSGNGNGSEQIGGASDAVLYIGAGVDRTVSSATLTTDDGSEIKLSSFDFAYDNYDGNVSFTVNGRRDNSTVGTKLINVAFETAASVDFTSPTSGSFENIDEIIITPASPIKGGFSIDDMVIETAILPVELTSFTAHFDEFDVNLYWETATEVNNYGFEVERASSSTTPVQEGCFEKIGFVQGHGNSNSPKQYRFIDNDPPSGYLQYRLKQIDTDGKYEYYSLTAEVDATITSLNDEKLPEQFHLSQNYPNPFNPITTIQYSVPLISKNSQFSIPNSQLITLVIYDVLGNEVSQLVNKSQAPGFYEVEFDGSNLSSGAYFYRLSAGSSVSTKKFILMK